jgi:WD40 repeat protein
LDNDKALNIAGKDRVNALCFSPDGQIIAAASPGAVKLWKAETGEEIKTYKGAIFFPSNAIGYSPDGKILAAAGANSVIKIWEIAKDDPSATVRGNFFRTINALAFSPGDTNLFATAGSDKQIQFWEAPSGNKIRTLAGHTGPINAVAFSQSGNALASTGEDKTIKLWNAAGGNLIESIGDRSCRSLAFTGKYLAAGGDGEISAYKITWAQPAASSSQPPLSSAVGGKTRKVGNFFKNAVNRMKRH